MTKKAYVIGSHVSQSLSPLIFNYWLRNKKIKAKYSFREISIKNFDKEINQILNEKDLCGFNVTTPFKELIIKKLDKVDIHAKKIGAVNFVIKVDGLWVGKNTDWLGFIKPLLRKTNNKKTKNNIIKKPIVIGYGGAAKAIIYALQKQGVKEIKIFNRTYKKIKHLDKKKQLKALKSSNLSDCLKKTTLIINTTPTNPLNSIKKINTKKLISDNNIAGYDIVYSPKETDFLSNFKNTKRIYGIDMLICQAVPCFEGWFGKKPPIEKNLFELLKKKIL